MLFKTSLALTVTVQKKIYSLIVNALAFDHFWQKIVTTSIKEDSDFWEDFQFCT